MGDDPGVVYIIVCVFAAARLEALRVALVRFM